MRRVLEKIDADGVFVEVVVGVPANRAGLEKLNVLVEIGGAQGDVGTSGRGVFSAGVAICALIGSSCVRDDKDVGAVEVGVVACAGAAVGLETEFHAAGALGNNFSRADELPAVGGVGGDGLADG